MGRMDQLVDSVAEEIVKYRLYGADGKRGYDAYQNQKVEDVLFFPRKKLKMVKLRSGNWEPRARFIDERLSERATRLDLPTDMSSEGLTSGLRSAIVREGDRYFRLKGVAVKTYESHVKRKLPSKVQYADKWGLCLFEEALNEQVAAMNLDYIKFEALGMTPAYIEAFFIPPRLATSKSVDQFFSNPVTRIDFQKPKTRQELIEGNRVLNAINSLFLDSPAYYQNSFVSAFGINGDTRVDEAFYELTKNKLRGKKARERDELMRLLSFRAGFSLAALNLLDISWGSKLEATNSHLGNFVISPSDGFVSVGLVDLDSIGYKDWFGNPILPPHLSDSSPSYYRHLKQDLKNFRHDFFADYTTSHPVSLPYREFSGQLRQECWMAFRSGYAIKSYAERKLRKSEILIPVGEIPESSLVAPSQLVISDKDFRDRIKYVTE